MNAGRRRGGLDCLAVRNAPGGAAAQIAWLSGLLPVAQQLRLPGCPECSRRRGSSDCLAVWIAPGGAPAQIAWLSGLLPEVRQLRLPGCLDCSLWHSGGISAAGHHFRAPLALSWSICSIFTATMSIATAFSLPRGMMMSAKVLLGSTNSRCIGLTVVTY
jgi:hypothetical protein